MDKLHGVGEGMSTIHQQPMSKGQAVVRVVLIMAFAETLIMLGLNQLPVVAEPISLALIDAVLLLILSTAPIYFLVVRPFAQAHEHAARKIGYLAYHDSLTDLPNRRMLFENLDQALSACVRHRNFGAVLLLDLDGFKKINDKYGHDTGDFFLRQISERLMQGKRQEDIAARLGGDEFVVLAQQLDTRPNRAEEKALAIAAKLQQLILQPVACEESECNVGCSIGIRLMEPQRMTAAQVIREADIAMYKAKTDRNSSVRVFRPTTTVVLPLPESLEREAVVG
jgi:diguanylate cyclase (GGDEF)-like protein